ncbi:spermine/spermidine synthase domain-containing protein [Actinomadura craniellae]|uniref:spermine/spermidine synthase domain-containing protein n=1 Tax=Actinomadura craniellae TaxID=2231787 RepID=UPI001F2A8119|nr:spermidine synthase [Actinomadura craniellae]
MDSPPPQILEHTTGANGELILRRTGPHHEIISNGVFLMDTRNGESERLLVTAALDLLNRPAHLAIGGLGVGFSLAAALRSPHTTAVTVIEKEPAVIGWHRTHLRHHSENALDDPRVHIHQADLLDWLHTTTSTYDALCLDIDNGPHWTVTTANAALYDDTGLRALRDRLTPGGILAIWSAGAAPAFTDRLRTHFTQVTTRSIPVPRGEPDLVYLATTAPPPPPV